MEEGNEQKRDIVVVEEGGTTFKETEIPSIRLVTNESPPSSSPQEQQRSASRSSTHLPELVLGPVFREKTFEKHLSIICLDEYEYQDEASTSSEVSFILSKTLTNCLTLQPSEY